MHGHEGSGLCAQTASAERYGLEACGLGSAHLVDAEIAFGTYQHQRWRAGLQDIEEERFLSFPLSTAKRSSIIAMGDEALCGQVGARDEALEGLHLIQLRQPCLVALLHSRDEDLLQPLRLHHPTLREAAVKEREAIHPHLRGLLGQPLHAVHVLRGSYRQMNRPTPLRMLRLTRLNAIAAAVVGGFCDDGTIEGTMAVHEVNLVTHLQP